MDTEILVFGQQDSPFGACERQDDVIGSGRGDLHDGLDVIASRAERDDHSEVTALIGENAHELCPRVGRELIDEDDVFVRECVGRKPHGRVDVFARQLRVSGE
jgi:hypothetical protein